MLYEQPLSDLLFYSLYFLGNSFLDGLNSLGNVFLDGLYFLGNIFLNGLHFLGDILLNGLCLFRYLFRDFLLCHMSLLGYLFTAKRLKIFF